MSGLSDTPSDTEGDAIINAMLVAADLPDGVSALAIVMDADGVVSMGGGFSITEPDQAQPIIGEMLIRATLMYGKSMGINPPAELLASWAASKN